MKIKEIKNRPEINQHEKLYASYTQFDRLLMELRTKELPNETVVYINDAIDRLNLIEGSEKLLRREIRSTQSSIINLLAKEHKLVAKNHYRNIWLAVGMTAFGIPFGAAFGLSFDNMAFLGMGMPIGLAIGMAVGTGMDNKAFEEGRQFDIELKH